MLAWAIDVIQYRSKTGSGGTTARKVICGSAINCRQAKCQHLSRKVCLHQPSSFLEKFRLTIKRLIYERKCMSIKLPPNRFYTFKDPSLDNGSLEITYAVFTRPGTPEAGVIDETNSYGVFLDRALDGIISLDIDDCRFSLTRKQASVLASRLTELSQVDE